jgi:Arc/MetJ family transcription regulator
MRVHLELDDALVAQIDQRSGTRNRSRFIRDAIAAALDESAGWDLVLSARRAIPDSGHEWDEDPAAWVSRQRRADADRVG